MINQYTVGIVAGVIAFLAYVVYVFAILRGGTKPSRVTWWIWTFMGLVVGLSYYASGARNTIWVAVAEFFGPLLIALLSIKYGEGTLKDKTDLFCFLGAIFSIILWIIFNNPLIALVTNLVIDAFALIPTIKKSYLRPEGEDFWGWFGTGTADFLNLFAIEKFTFGIILYPVYMFITDFIIILILLFRKKGIIKNPNFLFRLK